MSRRGITDLVGILPIDKPAGLTSHDVVARVRQATGEGRIGHAGTLDPLATGLLVVLIGPFTRLEPYLSSAEKRYDATIAFGAETDTDDAEGSVVRTADVPPEVLDPAYAAKVLTSLLGPQLQVPPAYSAIKVAGQVAHRAARSGNALQLEPRAVRILAATLRKVDPLSRSWDVSLHVSKGTYVRALARDIGRACGTAAHLTALRRTASGSLTLKDARSLADVEDAAAEGHISALLADPLHALALPVIEGDPHALAVGGAMPRLLHVEGLPDGAAVAVTLDGRLAGVYRADGERFVPAVVLPTEGAR